MAAYMELESGEPPPTARPNIWKKTSEPSVLFSFPREHISWTADDSGEERENKCTYMSISRSFWWKHGTDLYFCNKTGRKTKDRD